MAREYPQIEQAEALEPFVVRVRWTNGDEADVDLTTHVERFAKVFGPDIAQRWHEMEVEEWGWGVTWGDEAECGSALLWDMHQWAAGKSMSPKTFTEWMKRHGFTLDAASNVLGIGRRTVARYRSGESPVPRTVVLATRAVDLGALDQDAA